MPTENKSETTRMLVAWCEGDETVQGALMARVYDELSRIASGYLRHERLDHTLEASALVHEAYMRLIDQKAVSWRNRAHFLGTAAQMMRRILVDYARRRHFAKRGGSLSPIPLEDVAILAAVERAPDLVALDEALVVLSELDPQQARIVDMRYFGGLTAQEIAAAEDISVATVTRKWQLAKAWLYRRLS